MWNWEGLEQEKGAGQQEAGLGASWLSGENIWLPSAPHPVRHYYFCKMEQRIFSRTLESALCVGTVKHRVGLGRCPERLARNMSPAL